MIKWQYFSSAWYWTEHIMISNSVHSTFLLSLPPLLQHFCWTDIPSLSFQPQKWGAGARPACYLCHLLSLVSSLLQPGMLPWVGYTLCPGKKPFLWSTHLFTKSTEKMPQPTLSALPGFILILFFFYYGTSYNLRESGIKRSVADPGQRNSCR